MLKPKPTFLNQVFVETAPRQTVWSIGGQRPTCTLNEFLSVDHTGHYIHYNEPLQDSLSH